MEKLARIYDAEILPVWTQRFGKLLFRDLSLPERCQVLEVGCGTGYATMELIRRLDDGSRVIAIESSSALLDHARRKVEESGRKGVFFRTESSLDKLSFADGVYDLVVCNLGVAEMASPMRSLTEFARVTRPGGEVRCTIPLRGTFQEFYDIYREVLVKHDRHDTLGRLNRHLRYAYPAPEDCERWLHAAGLRGGQVVVSEFSMLFRSSREFFFAPIIEYGPLPAWKAVAGQGQEMQDVFWYIKEAIDAYFEGRAFQVTVKAACLIGTAPRPGEEDTDADAIDDDGLDTMDQVTQDYHRDDLDGLAEVELDAFVEGRRRPEHLGDGDPE
jgi:ubiquinone/menaquinone biosynthesis C-methylase UbiE